MFFLSLYISSICIEKQMLSNGTRIFDDQNKYNILFYAIVMNEQIIL